MIWVICKEGNTGYVNSPGHLMVWTLAYLMFVRAGIYNHEESNGDNLAHFDWYVKSVLQGGGSWIERFASQLGQDYTWNGFPVWSTYQKNMEFVEKPRANKYATDLMSSLTRAIFGHADQISASLRRPKASLS